MKKVGFASSSEDDDIEMQEEGLHQRKVKKAPPTNGGNPEHAKHYWVGNVRYGIKSFFKEHNPAELKRGGIVVDGDEAKETRSWLFFWLWFQILVLVIYGFGIKTLDTTIALQIAAVATCIPFAVRLLSILIFGLKRLFTGSMFKRFPPFDPENPTSEYREVVVCVPILTETKDVLHRTIRSIGNSKYPKNKLYMFFIVDGNRANTYENLLEVLRGEKIKGNAVIVPNKNNVEHGVYINEDKEKIFYSVYLKPENRGLRDSRWIFIEVLRSFLPEFRPHFTMFLDSDTHIDHNSIRALQRVLNTNVERHGDSFDDVNKRTGAIAGVTGKIRISNLSYISHDSKWDSFLYNLSNIILLGIQFFEYNWIDVYSRKVEDAYGSVCCLPGSFSMYRTDILCDFQGISTMRSKENNSEISHKELSENEWIQVKKAKTEMEIDREGDYFAKPLKGFLQRTTQEFGMDRNFANELISKGFHTKYEPNAIAWTEAPDSLSAMISQRKRWNNSEFWNNFLFVLDWRIWLRIRTIPVIFLAFYQLLYAYLLPVNSMFIVYIIWDEFIRWANETFYMRLSTSNIVFWWIAIQLIVIISTKLNTSEMFYALLTFITGALMVASAYFFVNFVVIPGASNIANDPVENWPTFILIVVWPAMHIIASLFSPLSLIFGIGLYIWFPTLTFTFSVFSFFNTDDYTWGR